MDSISSYDHETRLLSLTSKIVPGTTAWILENAEFIKWKTHSTHPFFLCTGIVGSGKTMLASLVAERLLSDLDPTSPVVLHYFVDPRYLRELSAAALLRGLIRQIATHLQVSHGLSEELRTTLEVLFGSNTESHNCPKLHHVLRKLLIDSKNSILIIDGLHELPEKGVSELLNIFRHLSSHIAAGSTIKFAIFSREQIGRNVIIQTALHNTIHLHLTLELLEADIAFFINERIWQKTTYERQITEDETLIKDVRSILRKNGKKMFLWIDLQLNTIWDTCFSEKDIRQALDGLPAGLEETYSRCLLRLSQDDRTKEYGYRILYLIAHAERPLIQTELREAISVQEMSDHWENSRCIQGQLVQYCANLIEQDQLTATIRFVHPSVRALLSSQFHQLDYPTISILTLEPYSEDAGFSTIGSDYCRDVCFKYLSLHDFNSQVILRSSVQTKVSQSEVLDKVLQGGNKVMRLTGRYLLKKRGIQPSPNMTIEHAKQEAECQSKSRQDTPKYHFLDYVQNHWPSHARSLRPEDSSWRVFTNIASTRSSSYRLHPWMDPSMNSTQFQQARFLYAVRKDNMALMIMSSSTEASGTKRTKRTCFTEMSVNERGSRPCHMAVSGAMMQWLIRIGGASSQLKAKDHWGRNALHASAINGSCDIMDLLLGYFERTDLLESVDKYGKCPLALALDNGHLDYFLHAGSAEEICTLLPLTEGTKLHLYPVLESIFRYRPTLRGKMTMLGPYIELLAVPCLTQFDAVKMDKLVSLALADDNLFFFSGFFEWKWPGITKGDLEAFHNFWTKGNILSRACIITTTTMRERIKIVRILVAFDRTQITRKVFIGDCLIAPLELAMARIIDSEVAVEVVSLFSQELLHMTVHPPPLIEEEGRPAVGDLTYLELLPRIKAEDVTHLLMSGTLILRRYENHLPPRDNILHVALMEESGELLLAIQNYAHQMPGPDLFYAIAALSSKGESALTMAIGKRSEVHLQRILDITIVCMSWVSTTYLGENFMNDPTLEDTDDQLLHILADASRNLPQLLRTSRITDLHESQNLTTHLAQSLYCMVIEGNDFMRGRGMGTQIEPGSFRMKSFGICATTWEARTAQIQGVLHRSHQILSRRVTGVTNERGMNFEWLTAAASTPEE
ncbi:hypothetical protein K504DRAFT_503207 [Pleomassaria siparia CBS 279.74]|uniref:Uncharacterized protein n=1 Tax=Pleomassaria siparia CBS 279.74 TaxID=1314801 RepID=A0A6G1K559_9PLEO|nr:hypothetical protein K504DRAFT_503207 [Pleomassaria siparia CBS 279.74]